MGYKLQAGLGEFLPHTYNMISDHLGSVYGTDVNTWHLDFTIWPLKLVYSAIQIILCYDNTDFVKEALGNCHIFSCMLTKNTAVH
jgi:hypothetical protein